MLLLPPDLSTETGASERGIHYWLSWFKCPRRYALSLAEERDTMPSYLKVGIYLHKLLEVYYTGVDYAIDNSSGDEAWAEAMRLFGGYKNRYPADEFTEVVGAEMSLEAKDEQAFGVPWVTGRADLVVCVDEEACERLVTTRPELGMLEPGLYLVDHKTASQRQRNLRQQVLNNFQFWLYMLLWEHVHGERPAGFIANYLFKYKRIRPECFASYFIGYPNEEQKKVLTSTLAEAGRRAKVAEKTGIIPANPTSCFGFGIICSHFSGIGGSCDRI